MSSSYIQCAYCGTKSQRKNGHINRAIKLGAPIYCNIVCAGLGRRTKKSLLQKKEEKRLYDIEYRRKNRQLLKQKKAEYHLRTYDPTKAAIERKKRMSKHIEYCRQPKYKAYKRKYDRVYRAKRIAGEFYESYLLILDIDQEVDSRISRHELYVQRGYYNKAQQRRREYARLNSNKSEECPLGNA